MLYLLGAGGGVMSSTNIPVDPMVGFFWHMPFHLTIPPTGWRWPPSNGKWYATGSGFGPSFAAARVGSIESYSGRKQMHPCNHAHIDGSLFYKGPNGENAWWFPQYIEGDPRFTEIHGDVVGRRLGVATGAPILRYEFPYNEDWVFNRHGVAERWDISGLPYNPWVLDFFQIVGDGANTGYITPGNPVLTAGRWYAWNYQGNLWENPGLLGSLTNVGRIRWDVVSPTRLRRHLEIECIWTGAGGLEASHWRSGAHYVYQAIEDTCDVHIAEVMSWNSTNLAARINTKFKRQLWLQGGPDGTMRPGETLDHPGYSQVQSVWGIYPGRSETASINPAQANLYCRLATSRARLLKNSAMEAAARNGAISDVSGIDSNMIENAAGVKDVRGIISPLVHGLKAVESGNLLEGAKAISSAYLVYKYVYENSIRDAQEISDKGPAAWAAITREKFSSERRRGMATETVPVLDTLATCQYFCSLYLRLKDSPFFRLWDALERVGLQPTPGQAWDLVPFSFVVDWFANVGGTLRLLEGYLSKKLIYDLELRIQTFRCSWSIPEKDIDQMFGTAFVPVGVPEFIWYSRALHGDFGSIDPIAASKGSGFGKDQMIQGGALVVQML